MKALFVSIGILALAGCVSNQSQFCEHRIVVECVDLDNCVCEKRDAEPHNFSTAPEKPSEPPQKPEEPPKEEHPTEPEHPTHEPLPAPPTQKGGV